MKKTKWTSWAILLKSLFLALATYLNISFPYYCYYYHQCCYYKFNKKSYKLWQSCSRADTERDSDNNLAPRVRDERRRLELNNVESSNRKYVQLLHSIHTWFHCQRTTKSFTYKVDVLSSTCRNVLVLVLFQQESHVFKLPSGTWHVLGHLQTFILSFWMT